MLDHPKVRESANFEVSQAEEDPAFPFELYGTLERMGDRSYAMGKDTLGAETAYGREILQALGLGPMPEILIVDTVRGLMTRVDEAYATGQLELAVTLDAELETCLDHLEHRLCDLDEGGDVLDGDNHVGIEDQFIAIWSQILAGYASFSLDRPAELAEHLREVLRSEAMQGPYSPGPFLDVSSDETLILLAADLWNERQALLLGSR